MGQARETLLNKVRADQEQLKQLEGRIGETKDTVERMKQRLLDLDSDLKGERSGDVLQNKVGVFFLRSEECQCKLNAC